MQYQKYVNPYIGLIMRNMATHLVELDNDGTSFSPYNLPKWYDFMKSVCRQGLETVKSTHLRLANAVFFHGNIGENVWS